MNERIKELIGRATVEVPLYYGPAGLAHTKKFDKEKFAELIIQECLDVMTKTAKASADNFTYMGDDVPTVVHQIAIEKHFGIISE